MKSGYTHDASVLTTTSQRFEAKYFIDEYQANTVLEFILPFVSADRYAKCYHVGTTYLDTPDLRLYRGSVCGEKNRFKLRVRSYRSNGNGHVYLEIKRRMTQVIRKERISVQTARVDEYLDVHGASLDDDLQGSSSELLALYHFCSLRDSLSATPRIDITYMREAYMSFFGDPVRITFDRNIACRPVSAYADIGCQDGIRPVPVVTNGVVLEIKFTDRCPYWVTQAVQRFNLQSQSVSKYVLSVDALKRQGISVGGQLRKVEP